MPKPRIAGAFAALAVAMAVAAPVASADQRAIVRYSANLNKANVLIQRWATQVEKARSVDDIHKAAGAAKKAVDAIRPVYNQLKARFPAKARKTVNATKESLEGIAGVLATTGAIEAEDVDDWQSAFETFARRLDENGRATALAIKAL